MITENRERINCSPEPVQKENQGMGLSLAEKLTKWLAVNCKVIPALDAQAPHQQTALSNSDVNFHLQMEESYNEWTMVKSEEKKMTALLEMSG